MQLKQCHTCIVTMYLLVRPSDCCKLQRFVSPRAIQMQLLSLVQSPGATAAATKSPYRSALIKAERKPEVVTLTESDLQRMLADAPIMTAEQVSSMRHAAEERKEAERAAAKARKEKMMRLEEEARKQVRNRPACTCRTILQCYCPCSRHQYSSCVHQGLKRGMSSSSLDPADAGSNNVLLGKFFCF
jgi:hypothetical protein